MWHQLKNYLSSAQTYADLSPDLRMRRRVNQQLRCRPALSAAAWHDEFYQATAASQAVIAFAYASLQRYSGLDLSRVRPGDRLVEDLQFPLVCWFDWAAACCDDFLEQFSVDLFDCFDETQLITVADLVVFLEAQHRSALPSA